MNRSALLMLLPLAWLATAGPARAHCEIPCGIFGDELRFELLGEHIDTIEKSIKEIQALSAKVDKTALDYNQLVRWIDNKDEHAEKLQHEVSQYFLHQRIKPVPESDRAGHAKYLRQLSLAHALLLGAMKAKQTVDLAVVTDLRRDLADLRLAYLGPPKKGK